MDDEHTTDEDTTDRPPSDEHATDKAELGSRDRAQPSLVEAQAEQRPDGDARPDREEREHLLDRVQDERGVDGED